MIGRRGSIFGVSQRQREIADDSELMTEQLERLQGRAELERAELCGSPLTLHRSMRNEVEAQPQTVGRARRASAGEGHGFEQRRRQAHARSCRNVRREIRLFEERS